MKKSILVLLVALSCGGCGEDMSRREYIDAVNECKAAGMDIETYRSALTGNALHVNCTVKRENSCK